MLETKAITLWQPWASAVALGLKRYETRNWSTRYRGPILIHAGQRFHDSERIFRREAILRLVRWATELSGDFAEHSLSLGCVVAVADLVECWPTEAVMPTDTERFFGDFQAQRWAWQLENVIRLASPIPCRGKQGLWVPPAEVVDHVMEMTP